MAEVETDGASGNLRRDPTNHLRLGMRSFSDDEYRARLNAVQNELRKRNADFLLADSFEHLGYITGFMPGGSVYQVAIVPMEGDPIMILRGLDEPTFVEQSWVTNYVAFSDHEDPTEILARDIETRGWQGKTFAVETDSHHLPVWRHESIKSALPEARFVDFSRTLWEMRLEKSPQETAYIREAGRIADAALVAAVDAVVPGAGERDVAAALYATAIKEGADNGRMALIASGKRSDSLHGALGRHTLETGDILHVESIPAFRGYGARLMRSTSIGSPSPGLADAAKQLIDLQEEQFAAMRPGAVAREIDAILRNGVLAAGIRDRYENTTGYTVGFLGALRTSDFTRCFLRDADWPLEEGMTFHMYAWAQGLAFSDTILVTEDGHERLTNVDRQLFVR